MQYVKGYKRIPFKDYTSLHRDVRFCACPHHHAKIVDYGWFALAAAHLLRSRLDSLQSFLLMLTDEIRFMSLGHLEPAFFNGDSLNGGTVRMHTSPASSYLEPIMTASDLASFADAPLLRYHIMVLVQEEHKKVSGYSATRKALADLANVLPLGCWIQLACVLL